MRNFLSLLFTFCLFSVGLCNLVLQKQAKLKKSPNEGTVAKNKIDNNNQDRYPVEYFPLSRQNEYDDNNTANISFIKSNRISERLARKLTSVKTLFAGRQPTESNTSDSRDSQKIPYINAENRFKKYTRNKFLPAEAPKKYIEDNTLLQNNTSITNESKDFIFYLTNSTANKKDLFNNSEENNFSLTNIYMDSMESYNYTLENPIYENYSISDNEVESVPFFVENVSTEFSDARTYHRSLEESHRILNGQLIGKFAKIKRDRLSNENFHQLQHQSLNQIHDSKIPNVLNPTQDSVDRNTEVENNELSSDPSLFTEEYQLLYVLKGLFPAVKNSTEPSNRMTEKEKIKTHAHPSRRQTTGSSSTLASAQSSNITESTSTLMWDMSFSLSKEATDKSSVNPSSEVKRPEIIRHTSAAITTQQNILSPRVEKNMIKSKNAFTIPVDSKQNYRNINSDEGRLNLVNTSKYEEFIQDCKDCLTSTINSNTTDTAINAYEVTQQKMNIYSKKSDDIENKSFIYTFTEPFNKKTFTTSGDYTTATSALDFNTVNYDLTLKNYFDFYDTLTENSENTETLTDSPDQSLNMTIDFANETSLNGTVSQLKLSMQEFPWPVKREAVVEGDIILGGLMMVHEREDTITCGPVMPQGGIQALEAMLYTLDKLNVNQLLPNITIGAHILDDCDKDTYGLEMAVDFIKGSISNIDGAEYHCNKTQVRKVISGVVGAASSVTSIQVANLLRLFKIPQVSFFSTSPELSNKQRFEFFTRTIPSDHYQVKAMVDIVKQMNWSYISIIYEESNYGIKAFEELEDLLAQHNICIAVKEKLVKDSGVADESAYDNIVAKLLTKPRARGAIIFGSDQEVAGVMRAVRRSNATGSFSWIGSDGWSARSLVSDGNEAEVEGTLSVQPQANPVQGFEEYFLSLNVENNRRNPWFVEFWEHHFQCRYANSSKTPYNQKHSRTCTGKEKLSKQNTVFEDQLQFVSDAVLAFAYAIRDMHHTLCQGKPGLCDLMKPTKGTELLKYLKKVSFKGLSGDQFHFDNNGDGPARYNIIHFKQISIGKYRWVRVGEYNEGVLKLNMSDIQFKLGNPKPPESVCSLPCALGQAKKLVEGESCCWHCFNCTQYQIRHPNDPTQCIVCPQGTVPDPHHVECQNIPEEYLRPDSGWAIGAMAFSSTGILITMFVCGVFIRHNDTPVVRASGRELSYVLLAGIFMCYSVTYALVLRPNDIVCGIQRFSAGFCFTVVYAALLTKTNRISRIFNAGKRSAKRPSFISPRSQLIICTGLMGVQVLINAVWMIISPAVAIHHYPTREDNLLVCSSYIDASYMIAFTYPIFLIVVCTIYAVLTRKIPEAFNESKHIGFTMYTTCVIWLAFVPLYFGTANHVALRITSMSVTISLSASVTVACLFSPKLYIILIRPERNVRQSMMPMRYSAISKTTGTAGSGSMMATVMVTAATCNQKQQIQKHVPPVEMENQNGIGSRKAETKESSTQTIPSSGSNSTLHKSSQEHLQKVNNNCNVGNGPLTLMSEVQMKDVPV